MKKSAVILLMLAVLLPVLTGCNKKKIEMLETQLATAEASLTAMTDAKNAGDAALTALGEERDAQLAQAGADLQALTEEKDARITELETQVQTVTEEKDARITELETQVQTVTDQKDTRITELETQLQTVTDQKDARITELETQVQTVTDQKDARITELETQLQTVTDQKDARITELETQVQTVTDQKDARITELETQLQTVTEQKDAELAEAEAALHAAVSEKNRILIEAAASLSAANDEHNSQMSEIEAALHSAIKEKNEITVSSDAAAAALTEEIAAMQAASDAEMHALTLESNTRISAAEFQSQEADTPAAENNEAAVPQAETTEQPQLAMQFYVIRHDDDDDFDDDDDDEIDDLQELLANINDLTVQEFPQDPEKSADPFFLGPWYVNETCWKNVCFDVGDIGLQIVYNFNSDNDLLITETDGTGKNTEEKYFWLYSDGFLTIYDDDEEIENIILMTDTGDMQVFEDDVTFTLQREKPAVAAVGKINSDAGAGDFFGNWELRACMVSGIYLPLDGFGVDGSLSISEKSIGIKLMKQSASDIPYTYADGVISFEADGLKYTVMDQEDGTLRVISDQDPENEFIMIFARAEK